VRLKAPTPKTVNQFSYGYNGEYESTVRFKLRFGLLQYDGISLPKYFRKDVRIEK